MGKVVAGSIEADRATPALFIYSYYTNPYTQTHKQCMPKMMFFTV